MINRNPAYQIAEDLPQLFGAFKTLSSDEFGFTFYTSGISFDQLNYILSLIIGESFQSSVNESGERYNSYSCKLQKCFGHLTEKSVFDSEIVIHQDSDVKPGSVNSSVNLANHVSDVIGEVGQELSGLMNKLKAKGKASKELDEEFERLTKILEQKTED